MKKKTDDGYNNARERWASPYCRPSTVNHIIDTETEGSTCNPKTENALHFSLS